MALETEGRPLENTILLAGVEALLQEPTRGVYYLAETTECPARIAGQLLITYEWSDWRNGVVWWIQSVYVTPQARGQGVYKGLYAYVQELANAEENVRGIRLYVDKRNTRAQQVYARLGMNGEHYQVFEWMK